MQLGYASIAHLAQGATSDTAHLLLSASDSREQLSVGIPRGRRQNDIYLITGEAVQGGLRGDRIALRALRRVLARTSEKQTATQHSYGPGGRDRRSLTFDQGLLQVATAEGR